MHPQWLQIVCKSLQRGLAVGPVVCLPSAFPSFMYTGKWGRGRVFLEHDLSMSRLYNCQRAPGLDTGHCQQVLPQVMLGHNLRIAQGRSLIFLNRDIYLLATHLFAGNTTGAIGQFGSIDSPFRGHRPA